jgi:hypothetical protein
LGHQARHLILGRHLKHLLRSKPELGSSFVRIGDVGDVPSGYGATRFEFNYSQHAVARVFSQCFKQET